MKHPLYPGDLPPTSWGGSFANDVASRRDSRDATPPHKSEQTNPKLSTTQIQIRSLFLT